MVKTKVTSHFSFIALHTGATSIAHCHRCSTSPCVLLLPNPTSSPQGYLLINVLPNKLSLSVSASKRTQPTTLSRDNSCLDESGGGQGVEKWVHIILSDIFKSCRRDGSEEKREKGTGISLF